MEIQVISRRLIMELDRLDRWTQTARFVPQAGDMFFAPKTGLYEMKDRVALIIRWRETAEREALNAILLMMYADKGTTI